MHDQKDKNQTPVAFPVLLLRKVDAKPHPVYAAFCAGVSFAFGAVAYAAAYAICLAVERCAQTTDRTEPAARKPSLLPSEQ